jgi:hypothetical protein
MMTPHCSTTARCWTGLVSRLPVHHWQEQQQQWGQLLLAEAAQRQPGRRPAVLVRQQRGGRAQEQLQEWHGEAADECTWAREGEMEAGQSETHSAHARVSSANSQRSAGDHGASLRTELAAPPAIRLAD